MEGGAVGHNFEGTHPRTIPARFGLFRFRGFRGEDLNVKIYMLHMFAIKLNLYLLYTVYIHRETFGMNIDVTRFLGNK